MRVDIADVPEGKMFSDYPKGTEFVLDDRPPRFDRKALENNQIKRIRPGNPGYDEALPFEDAVKMLDKPSE